MYATYVLWLFPFPPDNHLATIHPYIISKRQFVCENSEYPWKNYKRNIKRKQTFGKNRVSSYICNVIFFIVLDLRLTKVGVQRYSFFYAHTLTVVIWKLYKSLISVFLTSKDSKNQTNRLFHFCTLLLQTDSINQHLTKEKCTKNKAV